LRFHDQPRQLDYVQRVNRALDHITRHLAGDLRLEEVARAADFSPFHFHRVFKALVGESLAQFVKRLRLERAARAIVHMPGKPLTEIALECGFSSSSDFSRSFKGHYGVPPSHFDGAALRAKQRDELEATIRATGGPHQLQELPAGANPDGFEVELRHIPARSVAYVRVLNPYRSGEAVLDAYRLLMEWAESRGMQDQQWLGYQWEDPELVALEDCRYDVAVEVDEVEPSGPIGRYDFPAMLVAEVKMAGDSALELRAFDWLFHTWLPRSGFVPAHLPAFEAWIGRPFEHGLEHFTLALQLPVCRP